MRRIFTSFLALSITLGAWAVIEGDGYYRVRNYKTDRYVYVLDDKGEVNYQATTAELGALELWKNYDRTISDPSTIIYVKDTDGKKRTYDLQAQGTGVEAIINSPVTIYMNNRDKGFYSIYGSNGSVVRYIGDATQTTEERGYLTSIGNTDYHRWYFMPVSATDDTNYFGFAPEFQQGDDYYGSIFAAFPFSFQSEGMKAYYVSYVDKKVVNLMEVKGVVPANTPVIIKCSSATADGNRFNLGGNGKAVTDNLLRGVYFCNSSLRHRNQTANVPATMRVIGLMSDGNVGFVTSKDTYLPRNKAYIVVPEGTPAELPITYDYAGVSEVEADAAEGIHVAADGLTLRVESAEGAVEVSVYNVAGQLVATGVADGSPVILPSAGMYIVRTSTGAVKISVR